MPLCQSITRGIAACHLDCIPEYLSAIKYIVSNRGYSGLSFEVYQSATKYMQTCQLHFTPVYISPVYQSVTEGIVACHLKCISQRQSICRPASYILLQCISQYPGLECIDLPEYRSATKNTKTCQLQCCPGVSVSNLGYNSLSPGMFLSILCH